MRILPDGTAIPGFLRRFPEAFKVHEEEQLVPEDGAAEGRAELVLMEDALSNAWSLLLQVSRCQGLILVVGVKAAVELVGAALGHHDDFAAVDVAIFGVGVTSDDAHLAIASGAGL